MEVVLRVIQFGLAALILGCSGSNSRDDGRSDLRAASSQIMNAAHGLEEEISTIQPGVYIFLPGSTLDPIPSSSNSSDFIILSPEILASSLRMERTLGDLGVKIAKMGSQREIQGFLQILANREWSDEASQVRMQDFLQSLRRTRMDLVIEAAEDHRADLQVLEERIRMVDAFSTYLGKRALASQRASMGLPGH